MQIELTKLASWKLDISRMHYTVLWMFWFHSLVYFCLLELVLRTFIDLFPRYRCNKLSVSNAVRLVQAMTSPRDKLP